MPLLGLAGSGQIGSYCAPAGSHRRSAVGDDNKIDADPHLAWRRRTVQSKSFQSPFLVSLAPDLTGRVVLTSLGELGIHDDVIERRRPCRQCAIKGRRPPLRDRAVVAVG